MYVGRADNRPPQTGEHKAKVLLLVRIRRALKKFKYFFLKTQGILDAMET